MSGQERARMYRFPNVSISDTFGIFLLRVIFREAEPHSPVKSNRCRIHLYKMFVIILTRQ